MCSAADEIRNQWKSVRVVEFETDVDKWKQKTKFNFHVKKKSKKFIMLTKLTAELRRDKQRLCADNLTYRLILFHFILINSTVSEFLSISQQFPTISQQFLQNFSLKFLYIISCGVSVKFLYQYIIKWHSKNKKGTYIMFVKYDMYI